MVKIDSDPEYINPNFREKYRSSSVGTSNHRISKWITLLVQTTPETNTKPHAWIYTRLKNGTNIYEVHTEQSYQKQAETDSSLKKLTFKEVIEHSNEVMRLVAKIEFQNLNSSDHHFYQKLQGILEQYLENNIFQRKDDITIEETKYACQKLQNLKIISSCLEKMANRATYKHTVEKCEGIFGKLKSYLWSIFYNKSELIEKTIPNINKLYHKLILRIQTHAEEDFQLSYDNSSSIKSNRPEGKEPDDTTYFSTMYERYDFLQNKNCPVDLQNAILNAYNTLGVLYREIGQYTINKK